MLADATALPGCYASKMGAHTVVAIAGQVMPLQQEKRRVEGSFFLQFSFQRTLKCHLLNVEGGRGLVEMVVRVRRAGRVHCLLPCL